MSLKKVFNVFTDFFPPRFNNIPIIVVNNIYEYIKLYYTINIRL